MPETDLDYLSTITQAIVVMSEAIAAQSKAQEKQLLAIKEIQSQVRVLQSENQLILQRVFAEFLAMAK
jgi:hypothetical protein